VLAQIGSSDYEPESIVNEVHRVRVFGDVAIVVAQDRQRQVQGLKADMTFIYYPTLGQT
jgi:hypothetical protein